MFLYLTFYEVRMHVKSAINGLPRSRRFLASCSDFFRTFFFFLFFLPGIRHRYPRERNHSKFKDCLISIVLVRAFKTQIFLLASMTLAEYVLKTLERPFTYHTKCCCVCDISLLYRKLILQSGEIEVQRYYSLSVALTCI